MNYEILCGDAVTMLRGIPDGIARCCVTSPPYYGLRDYGVEGQIGTEETPEEYVSRLVSVFREVRRVLAEDGTLWLNIGDSYFGTGSGQVDTGIAPYDSSSWPQNRPKKHAVIKSKDLVGVPWMLAFALRADGWYLRQDIIWHKPNPMPEPVKDRCTKAHEYLFLLSKKQKYYFDHTALQEPTVTEEYRERGRIRKNGDSFSSTGGGLARYHGNLHRQEGAREFRNKRSVWTVTLQPYKEAHFATFPPSLITPCILAGSRPGDIVLDPFNGAGTTGLVAMQNDRLYVGIELNPQYVSLTHRRFADKLTIEQTGDSPLILDEDCA